ncbi:kynurenine/alpha-aminoadipate aminotransferase, mitochondrial-like isoform X2 [Homarus americanus]|uniref:kynurenine/alpha-aminoadipate aminotransferase, mitochondrial-like isoform X2 n=1 Tax=Homarus americanus TaxID=6706 RepID=UPI001C456700|nr:kynurenine/alpha-aminoadipate aminotransferase, mitochondrial-like isoform X2 [Homarus americanus]
MDYSRFISTKSSNRMPSGISSFLDEPSPSLVWLCSGMPSPEKFPIREMNLTLQDGKVLSITPECLSAGLQYGPAPGYIPLVKQLKTMTKSLHSPPLWEESDLLVTIGSQAGLWMAFEMLLNPGDFVVVQKTCYSDVLCMLTAVTPQYLAIESDDEGLQPDCLRTALKEVVKNGSKNLLKALYVVPNSCNPTGTSMGEERRREIYAIAQEYDLIILEDDPYYFLQYDEKPPPSFLSLDTDGRVLRFDSFSKIISAGLRVGYVTGPAMLLERLNIHMMTSVICGPMLSQVIISTLLQEWGEDGFKKYVVNLHQFYRDKRDVAIQAAEIHLTGLCEWIVPKGGIFLWLKVPKVADTTSMLVKRGVKKNIVLVPGKYFMADSNKPCQYMRAAFSCATADQLMKGFKNLAELIREEIALQNAQIIDP